MFGFGQFTRTVYYFINPGRVDKMVYGWLGQVPENATLQFFRTHPLMKWGLGWRGTKITPLFPLLWYIVYQIRDNADRCVMFPNVAFLQGLDPILSMEVCENARRVVFLGIWPVFLYSILSAPPGLIKWCTAKLARSPKT